MGDSPWGIPHGEFLMGDRPWEVRYQATGNLGKVFCPLSFSKGSKRMVVWDRFQATAF